MITDNGRFMNISVLCLSATLDYDYVMVSLKRIFLFFNSFMNGSRGTHCSGGTTPRVLIVPSTVIWAMIEVGNAVVRIIDVIFDVLS